MRLTPFSVSDKDCGITSRRSWRVPVRSLHQYRRIPPLGLSHWTCRNVKIIAKELRHEQSNPRAFHFDGSSFELCPGTHGSGHTYSNHWGQKTLVNYKEPENGQDVEEAFRSPRGQQVDSRAHLFQQFRRYRASRLVIGFSHLLKQMSRARARGRATHR